MAEKFTLTELKKYNGVDSPAIYVALKGTVFDVTSKGQEFYGPGAPYEVFAGHDISRGMACRALTVQDDHDDLGDLDADQIKTLDMWYKQFTDKYPVVGKVVP